MATTTILFLFKIINNRTDSALLLRFINFNDRSRSLRDTLVFRF